MSSTIQEPRSSDSLWWNRPIIYWQANQAIITFHSPIDFNPSQTEKKAWEEKREQPESRKQREKRIIASLQLETLQLFLEAHGFQLKSFTNKDIPHPTGNVPPPEGSSQVSSHAEEEEPAWGKLVELEEELEQLEAEAVWLKQTYRQQPSFSLLRTLAGEPYETPRQRHLAELQENIKRLESEIEKREHNLRQSGESSDRDDRDDSEPSVRGINSPIGKYLFPPAAGQGTLAICCFHSVNPTLPPTSSRHGHGKEGPTTTDTTQAIVSLLNLNLGKLRQDGKIPISAAMPNWIGGSTPPISFGCPAAPAIPVTGDHPWNNQHFTLPELNNEIREQDGDGVTVFVLDTIPTASHIELAAQHAGKKNALLQSIAAAIASPSHQIIIHHQWVPKRLTSGIQTGIDLFHNLYGFRMPDHGIFVTGIIHDIVPKARIECVRVLNDSGVGDVHMLCAALSNIQKRLEKKEFAQVVVNLSLVISPPDDKLPGIWFGNTCCYHAQDLAAVMQETKLLRLGLHLVIQSLTAQGAIIVAASGNESEAATHTAQAGPQRYGPRYPAAYPEVISVGAVDKHGQATTYSDYPALPPEHNGIATYGGAIPIPVPPNPLRPSEPEPPGLHSGDTWAVVDDAVVGVYCSSDYPKLSAYDPQPLDYPNPDESYGWAYWSGTSFSTPIISALAARVLQEKKEEPSWTSLSVQNIITTAPGQELLTTSSTSLPNTSAFGLGVGVLHAEQTSS